jgi:hypothetical protein
LFEEAVRMQISTRWVKRLASVAVLAACASALTACGGSDDNPPPAGGVTASYVSADGAAAPDLIRLVQQSVSGNTVTLAVTIGGTTTSSDYYAFAFDILIGDTTVASFLGGSATAGPFLGAPLTTIASASGSRVVVGISRQGAVAGVGSANPETTVLSLTFAVLKAGSTTLTFTGSPGNPALAGCSPSGAEAVNSAGTCITSEVFGSGGTISGS